VIAAAQQHPPQHPRKATSFLDEMASSIGHALRSQDLDCDQPEETSQVLIQLTLAGGTGWSGVEAILNLLGAYTPMQIVLALRRLGYVDTPADGHRIYLVKDLDHPSGPVVIETYLHAEHVRRHDLRRVCAQTKLDADEMWRRAIEHDLPVSEYNDHLRGQSRVELLTPGSTSRSSDTPSRGKATLSAHTNTW
jgi:hypothetical protein